MRVSHVTCADGLCYLSETAQELQWMMSASEKHSNREQYIADPTMSVAVIYNCADTPSITFYGKDVPEEYQTVHPESIDIQIVPKILTTK